jgi:nucleoside-diphosphate-sugar epimerase
MAFYLVTGGAGFIGSHLAEFLADRGHRVRVLDNLLTGRFENMASFLDRVEFIQGDIRDIATCRRAVEGVDYILHQAALPSVPRSIENPGLAHDINVNGTLNILIAARDAGVRNVVLASSSSVYGDDPELPKREGREGRPLSPYALTKLVNEKYGRMFFELYGLRTVSLRYFNVFGPRQDPASQYAAVIPLFITSVLNGKAPVIYGDGEQSRDFTYVANVVEANITAAECGAGAGEVFNVACGESLTVNGLLAAVNRVLGADVRPRYEDPRPGDVRHSLADIARAREVLAYAPRVTFEEGLRRTAAWYRSALGRE